MAKQLILIKMSRWDQQPWGLRLQGGTDFGQPLTVQKVTVGGLAEKAGLCAGDTIVKVDNVDLENMRHKDALDAISRAGNCFDLSILRYMIWKPEITALNEPVQLVNGDTLLTKTSLAASYQPTRPIGSGHNAKPTPFPAALQNNKKPEPPRLFPFKPVYNEASIAETLSSQAEVLPQGVIGVNFKKNEKHYDSTKSAVFKMLQEVDQEPEPPVIEADYSTRQVTPATADKMFPLPQIQVNNRRAIEIPIIQMNRPVQLSPPTFPAANNTNGTYFSSTTTVKQQPSMPPGLRSVQAPVSKPAPTVPVPVPVNPHCAECDRPIVGVFVRLKEKNLHVECFKCATCGTSLKNVGYYKVNEKLYCDVHARQRVRQDAQMPLF